MRLWRICIIIWWHIVIYYKSLKIPSNNYVVIYGYTMTTWLPCMACMKYYITLTNILNTYLESQTARGPTRAPNPVKVITVVLPQAAVSVVSSISLHVAQEIVCWKYDIIILLSKHTCRHFQTIKNQIFHFLQNTNMSLFILLCIFQHKWRN